MEMGGCSQEVVDELVKALPGLRQWAVRFSTIEYDADSLVTDAIINFLKDPTRYNNVQGPLRNLLFSYIKNKSVDFQRSYNRKYRKMFREHLRRGAPLFVLPVECVDESKSDLEKSVDDQLQSMPIRLAISFRLAVLHDTPHREIAALLQTSVGNVRSMVYRVRARLREALAAA